MEIYHLSFFVRINNGRLVVRTGTILFSVFCLQKGSFFMNNYEKIGDTVIISLPEEVDDYRAGKIIGDTDEMFADKRVKYVIFDFKKTRFMDSSGIGLITRRFRDVYDRGGSAYVLSVNERMEKILSMSGIYRIVKKTDSLEDAYRSMHM